MKWTRTARLRANELRKSRGVTVRRLCKAMKISKSTYYRRLKSDKAFEAVWGSIMDCEAKATPTPLTPQQIGALRQSCMRTA